MILQKYIKLMRQLKKIAVGHFKRQHFDGESRIFLIILGIA